MCWPIVGAQHIVGLHLCGCRDRSMRSLASALAGSTSVAFFPLGDSDTCVFLVSAPPCK